MPLLIDRGEHFKHRFLVVDNRGRSDADTESAGGASQTVPHTPAKVAVTPEEVRSLVFDVINKRHLTAFQITFKEFLLKAS